MNDPSNDMLRWHHRLGHISFKKLKIMAKLGILPKKFLTCPIPVCTSCLFGKATRKPWRNRHPRKTDEMEGTITKPGQCVSVDQMESRTPGLIGQLRGMPTKLRYKVETVFVDHYSGLGYVHLQKSSSAEETIIAKQAFEQYAASFGIKILHYHADNGIFADNKWRQAV